MVGNELHSALASWLLDWNEIPQLSPIVLQHENRINDGSGGGLRGTTLNKWSKCHELKSHFLFFSLPLKVCLTISLNKLKMLNVFMAFPSFWIGNTNWSIYANVGIRAGDSWCPKRPRYQLCLACHLLTIGILTLNSLHQMEVANLLSKYNLIKWQSDYLNHHQTDLKD